MRGYRKGKGSGPELVTASEVAAFAYCPEQWRLEYGLERLPANTAALEAGTKHHAGTAVSEQVAGQAVGIGQVLVLLGLAALLLLWMVGR